MKKKYSNIILQFTAIKNSLAKLKKNYNTPLEMVKTLKADLNYLNLFFFLFLFNGTVCSHKILK